MKRLVILVLALLIFSPLANGLAQQAVDFDPDASQSPLVEQSTVDDSDTLQMAYSEAIGQDTLSYHFQSDGAGYTARNDAHNLNIAVNDVTVAVAVDEDIWQMTSNAPAHNFTLANNRLTIHREGYDEWYINDAMGLQQGFTLYEPSDISFDIGGTLETTASTDSLMLGDDLTFSGLMAFDAKGKDVPVRFSLDGERLAYVYDDMNATYPLIIDPWVQQAILTEPVPVTNHNFGTSVAFDGNTALISVNDQHAANVYVRSGSTWNFQAELPVTLDTPVVQSVDIDGDTALVGAQYDDCPLVSNCGRAYVFTRSGTTWTQQAALQALDPGEGDNFGYSVALDGDTAVIGAPRDDGPCGDNCGSAYVFTRSGTTWSQQAKLVSTTSNNWTTFGNSVAVDGDTVLIGAEGEECIQTGQDCGSVYVFTRTTGVWNQQAKLFGDNIDLLDNFGSSVALQGDRALIGDSYADCLAPGFNTWCGLVYVFNRSGSTWTQQAILEPDDATSDQRFGDAVALDGDTALIGAYGDRECSTGYVDCGSAYIFKRIASNYWQQLKKFQLADSRGGDGFVGGDQFGNSVALQNGTALVGAPGRAISPCPLGCGSTYVYIHEPDQTLTASAVCNGSNLDLTIANGDGPFNITTSAGINTPVYGVIVGTTTINGPEKWDDVTIAETTGDLESLNLGQFKCRTSDRPALYWPEHRAHTVNRNPTFIWGPITDANNYRLFLFDDANAAQRTVDIRENSGGATSYIVQTQLPLGRIFWRVRARTNRVWGLWSVRYTLFIDPVVLAPEVQVNAPVPTVELSTPLPPTSLPDNGPPDNGPPPTVEAPPPTDLPAPPNSR